MPSRNSKSNSTDRESYMHCLDQLGEILNTYSGTHAVIILGDMNASMKARKGNLQDTLLIHINLSIHISLTYPFQNHNSFVFSK